METLNLGILAHVDAGKTSLTERILFQTGVISAAGSVDKGTTQTDTLELERARGITIKAAVASFTLGDRTVNLIDTPGHADFVAEVERSLRVLDAVVLVISAVEGVQPQTRRLAKAITAAGLPLVIFINKIDRLGARGDALLEDIRRKLGLRLVPLTSSYGLGERTAGVRPCDWGDSAWRDAAIDVLAETDERVIEAYDRHGGDIPDALLDEVLRAQVSATAISPVFVGSAITGAGVPELLAGIGRWIVPRAGDPIASLSGSVFKIARKGTGEKMVYVRIFDGMLAVRQRVVVARTDSFGEQEGDEERVTAIERFNGGTGAQADRATAGEIVRVHGLRSARIGDYVGAPPPVRLPVAFPPPVLESVVSPVDPGQIATLRTAMEQLAEQDPLISLQQRNESGDLSVRLYGEVQKEVLEETLARDYGVRVNLGISQTICVERPIAMGEHVELLGENGNPFWATIGFRIEPGMPGTGIRYERELGSLPLAFYRIIEETVRETLAQGLCGWEVIDCLVTLTHAGFSSVMSTGTDFRKLTPFVLMRALFNAGTSVCEPYDELELEIPGDTYGAVCGALINARATVRETHADGETHRLVCDIPTVELRDVERQLPGLTRGEGGWGSRFASYVPVPGNPPSRPRRGPNLFNREGYFAEALRH